ncbi:MAG: hypothetical protein H6602_01235 [Flavobacteriales bacterium]|nr:hypothetical protein [Flavobacteriales bacterium]
MRLSTTFLICTVMLLNPFWQVDLNAQNIRYEVDGLNKYVGCGDGNGNPEPVINARVRDNINTGWSDWNNSGDEVPQGWWGVTNNAWRNYGAYANYTTIYVELRGYERDPGITGDDCGYGYTNIATETIRSRAPCTWHSFFDGSGGGNSGTWRVKWQYYYHGQTTSGYDNTWIGYNSGWNNAYNWSLCTVPTNGHNVYIPQPSQTIGNVNPIIPTGYTARANTITIDASNGAEVSIQGTGELLIN